MFIVKTLMLSKSLTRFLKISYSGSNLTISPIMCLWASYPQHWSRVWPHPSANSGTVNKNNCTFTKLTDKSYPSTAILAYIVKERLPIFLRDYRMYNKFTIDLGEFRRWDNLHNHDNLSVCSVLSRDSRGNPFGMPFCMFGQTPSPFIQLLAWLPDWS